MSFWFLPLGSLVHTPDGDFASLPNLTLPDLSSITAQHQLRSLLEIQHPEVPPENLKSMMLDIWGFYHDILPEDILLIPSEDKSTVHFVEVQGIYQYAAAGGYHSYRVTTKKTASIHTLPQLQLLMQGKNWCILITDSTLTQKLQTKVPDKKFYTRRIMQGIIASLLFIKLLVLGVSYWKDTLSQHLPF